MSSEPIPYERITRAGVEAPSPVSTAEFSDFVLEANDGNKWIVVTNGSADAATLLVIPQQTFGGLDLQPQECSVAAGHTEYFGPWPPALFNDARGAVQITTGEGAGTLTLYAQGI